MKIVNLLAAALLALAAAAFPAHAESLDNTAGELLEMCKSPYDTDYGYCAGYVLAISHVMTAGPFNGYKACGQAPVKSQQLMDIYISYADVFPEMMAKDAASAVAAAIARAFPCR